MPGLGCRQLTADHSDRQDLDLDLEVSPVATATQELSFSIKLSCTVRIEEARQLPIMQDDLILVMLTIKIVCTPLFCLPSSLSVLSGAFLDWSVLIAAFRLASVISALVE